MSAVMLYLLDAHQAAIHEAAPRRRESAEDEAGDEEQDRTEAEVLALADRLRFIDHGTHRILEVHVVSPDARRLYLTVRDRRITMRCPGGRARP